VRDTIVLLVILWLLILIARGVRWRD